MKSVRLLWTYYKTFFKYRISEWTLKIHHPSSSEGSPTHVQKKWKNRQTNDFAPPARETSTPQLFDIKFINFV
jgi:hypothetical protein